MYLYKIYAGKNCINLYFTVCIAKRGISSMPQDLEGDTYLWGYNWYINIGQCIIICYM